MLLLHERNIINLSVEIKQNYITAYRSVIYKIKLLQLLLNI